MIIALTGGVGGAKLIHGLAAVLSPDELTIVVNTGDDFKYLGLSISPDLDSVMYNLAGINNTESGWGVAGETWNVMQAMSHLKTENWFQLGDKDLATHLERSRLLQDGKTLSEATEHLCGAFKLKHTLIPMTDAVVKTYINTHTTRLDFQDYFVKFQCEPIIQSIVYEGADFAKPSPAFLRALIAPRLEAIVICPSNPMLSIAPILAIREVKEIIMKRKIPVIALSPLMHHKAFKGPTVKVMNELGFEASVIGINTYYRPFLTTLMIDPVDIGYVQSLQSSGLKVAVKDISLDTPDKCIAMAHEILRLVSHA